MNLSPPIHLLGTHYDSLDELIKNIQLHVGTQGYAVCCLRTKKSAYTGLLETCYLCCDRGRKERMPTGQKRKHDDSRRNDCPFSVVAKSTNGSWFIREIRNPNHNHSPTVAASHPSLRKLHITPTITSEIERETQVNLRPGAIIDSLRLSQGENFNDDEPTYKTKDIYNIKAELRRKNLGVLTSIQALMQKLSTPTWDFSFQKDGKERVTHLYFTKNICETKLKANPEVLIMDCTYKSNKYRLPLLNVVRTTCLNTTFYVAFGFLLQERIEDFTWFLRILQTLYRRLDLEDPKVIVTDRDSALMAAIRNVFPHTKNLLCLWHINKCVQVEWKPVFQNTEKPEEEWQIFYDKWREVIYAKTENAYYSAWRLLSDTYKNTFPKKVDYLYNTWLVPHKQKFVKCYTDKICHYGNVVTSRVEGGHTVLKSKLGISTGDLLTVVTNIDSLLRNQHQEYIIALGEAKNNTPMILKGANTTIYRDLTPYVTPFALLRIHEQYRRLADKSQPLPPCTQQFSTTMGLPCVHRIEAILSSEEEAFLQREEIDSKWWFERPPRHEGSIRTIEAIDPLLPVHDPPIAQAKGRPTDLQRNLRREKEKEVSIRREPSQFEIVDHALEKSRLQKQKLESKVTTLRKSHPRFRKPDMYLSVPKRNLPIESESEKRDRARRRIEIEKKEERLLEKRIKDVEAELRNLGASRKEVHETYSEGVQAFFRKARRWRAEKIENNLLQQIEDEDIELNEELCAERMLRSNGMDKIWERYDQDFLAEPRNRIHRLDKIEFEKWAKETGYTYTPIRIPPSQSLLDNFYQERRVAKELFYISKEDENQYNNDVALLHHVKMREHGRVPPEDITDEEEERSSSESDPKPDLNETEDLYSHRITKKLRPTQPIENAEIILREHTTRSGRITSVKLPVGLQRDGTQIRKVRHQEHS